MARPLDRKTLHARQPMTERAGGTVSLENTLDALLNENSQQREPGNTESRKPEPPSPIESLRNLFRESLVPHMNEIAERYRAKGVDLNVDASDFLAGGRGLIIDISYGERRVVLEGTVIEDKIAFSEANYVGGVGGTMSSGASLRTANMDADRFGQFVYERIISLVRNANGH